MIKLNILMGEKDKSNCVFIQEEGKERQQLTFDVIKGFSIRILEAIISGNEYTYELSVVNNELIQYSEVIEKVFKSIIDDKELQEVYKSVKNKNSDNNSDLSI